ncbi:hypothetical protein ACYPKM_02700 [Pseudomonas aeruginosa]
MIALQAGYFSNGALEIFSSRRIPIFWKQQGERPNRALAEELLFGTALDFSLRSWWRDVEIQCFLGGRFGVDDVSDSACRPKGPQANRFFAAEGRYFLFDSKQNGQIDQFLTRTTTFCVFQKYDRQDSVFSTTFGGVRPYRVDDFCVLQYSPVGDPISGH